MSPSLAWLLLPYTRAELSEWQSLLHWAGVGWEAGYLKEWHADAPVLVRGKEHRFLMKLDRADWAQRLTYFLGRYYEFGVLRVLDLVLRPGDHFVDIGANIGMISLHARSRVGAAGRVDCIEPNPVSAAALRKHVALNRIENVGVHEVALSDAEGELELNLMSDHSGTATLTAVDVATESITVPVVRGDALIGGLPRLIKIDVEGFELNVLKGLDRTIEQHHPMLIIEMIDEHLARAGTGVEEVARWLFDRGYEAYLVSSHRRRRYLPERLHLRPLPRPEDMSRHADVFWRHPSQPLDGLP